MPNGGRLTIETRSVDLDESHSDINSDVSPGTYVMLAVTDSGQGIPADIIE